MGDQLSDLSVVNNHQVGEWSVTTHHYRPSSLGPYLSLYIYIMWQWNRVRFHRLII